MSADASLPIVAPHDIPAITSEISVGKIGVSPPPVDAKHHILPDLTVEANLADDPVYNPCSPIKKKRSRSTKDGGKTSRNSRGRAFRPTQYSALIKCYKVQNYPSRDQLANIAQFVDLSVEKCKIWFQNCRVRGIPDQSGVVDIPVTGEQILDGSARTVQDAVPLTTGTGVDGPTTAPFEAAYSIDREVQCSLMSERLIKMYEEGALDHVLSQHKFGGPQL
ncbi:Homeobox domain [Carpediemonas membranifera]|uniref:Homeobox domain n=1 Tax=Carpediemonas membranifera TaxID=201153 RepID=A0A8J6E243_9EUKA|nr:Homeobox domain [Carpediemonas membranifera]|eukprot:KAG9393851.1 Homeobox domain [Carpediemonas membranifera]